MGAIIPRWNQPFAGLWLVVRNLLCLGRSSARELDPSRHQLRDEFGRLVPNPALQPR